MRYRSPCIAAAILLVANAVTLGAQQAGITAIPDSIVTRIDRAFASLGGAQAPGCAIGISQAGQPVLTRAYGMANLEYSVPNTAETMPIKTATIAGSDMSSAVCAPPAVNSPSPNASGHCIARRTCARS